jgi:hypothetical protein
MRRIYISNLGIHFETDRGQVNAHWRDFLGIGIDKSFKGHTLLSISRFWKSVYDGVRFLITGRFGFEK